MQDKFYGNIFSDSSNVSVSVKLKSNINNLEVPGKVASDVLASYYREGETPIQIIVHDLASIDSAWQSGGWLEVSSLLAKGLYRFDIPNEAFASGSDWVIISVTVGGCYVFQERYNLEDKIESTVSAGVLEEGFADTYISVSGADNYFATKLNTDTWDNTDNTTKLKALQQSTRAIDRLKFKGIKVIETQDLEFPRTVCGVAQTDIPDEIKIACAEIAASFLEGVDPEEEMRTIFKDSHTYASTKTTYDSRHTPEWLRAGIPSAIAWSYLKPFLVDPRSITLERVS